MSNLLIEMGNTALKAVWAEGDTLGKTIRYQGEKTIEFIQHITEKEKPNVMVLASVRDISSQDEDVLKTLCRELVLIDKKHPSILRAYGLPEYLSPDRAAGVIAVRKLFAGRECIVFDFGTILSIDFISEDGSYLGGNVSLGCRTRFKAINRYSKNLPLVNTPKELTSIGSTLVSSVEAGVMLGIKFEVDAYIASRPESVVIYTGGDANLFVRYTRNSAFVVNNLVLMGLAVISLDYEKNWNS
ncbi:MAG: type III pantothenate kinase [Bacteroidales bacterium]|nr:type III pantothenate kinase [Bacteroidales bacterium]MDY5459713.1 type III pantothenate kinase [Candidatus Cryptobacteroides sp.]MEE0340522.1 type III pantothenate kinase [Bacteroidales bacterium]